MRLRHKTRWAIVLVAALLALVSYSAVAGATDVVPTIGGPALALSKDGAWFDSNGDGWPNPGEKIEYNFTVTNTGNVTLHDITILDAFAHATGGPIPVLEVGASDSTTFTGSRTIYQEDIDRGWVNNRAFVDCDEDVQDDADATVYLPQHPVITIDKTTVDFLESGDGITILTGEMIMWQYAVHNGGNVRLTDVAVDDDVLTSHDPSYSSGDTNHNGKLDPGRPGTSWPPASARPATTATPAPRAATTSIRERVTERQRHRRLQLLRRRSQIDIDKVTVDGDTKGDGLNIHAGKMISWEYTVTNTGNVPIGNVMVDDSEQMVTVWPISGDDNNDGYLDTNETWIFVGGELFGKPALAKIGAYSNTGTVTGEFTDDAGHIATLPPATPPATSAPIRRSPSRR